MSIDTIREALLWSTLINYSVLLCWFLAFRFAHDGLFRLHGRWFQLSTTQFDALHYAGMAIVELTGAARLYRAAPRERSERGCVPG